MPPSICVTRAELPRRTAPRLPKSKPSVANTAENPTTNSTAPASVRPRPDRTRVATAPGCCASAPGCCASAPGCCASAPDMAVT